MINAISEHARAIFKSRLAKKQLLFILVFSTIITLIGTLIQLAIEYRNDIRYIDTQMGQIASSHLDSLTNSLWTLDDQQIEIQMNNMLSLRDIVYLEITEAGQVKHRSQQSKIKTDRVETFPMVHTHKGERKIIGELHVHASFGGVYQRMLRRIVVILTTQGLKTFFVSLFILYILHRQVIRYLIKIAAYTQKLNFDELDVALDIQRPTPVQPDELNTLVAAVNSMRQRLSNDLNRRRQAELAIKAFFDQSLVMLFIVDMQTNTLVRVNNEVRRITGRSKDALSDRPLLDLIHPEDHDATKHVLSQLSSGTPLSGYQCRHLTAAGECRTFEWHAAPDIERKLLYAMAQDITARKTAEDALLRYEHIISSTNDLMSFVDSEYRYQAVNDAYLRAHAKKREDIVGASVAQIMGTEKFTNKIKGYLDRALSGKIQQYQSWFDYATLGQRFMDVTYHPFKGRQGTISGVVASAHDLTHRKQIEEALQLSLDKFEKTFQTAPIWVVLSAIDDGLYLEVNDAILSTLGYRREELIGETSIELKTWVNISDRDRIVSEVKKSGSIKNIEVQRKTKSGHIIDTLFSAGVLQLDGKPIMISVSQDITDQKKAESERQHLQTQLLQSQRIESVGRLAGGVAHDLNNLLSPILGYAEMLLLDAVTTDPHRVPLQEIVSAALRARDLVQQLLAFSRKQTMKFKSIDMNTMVRNFKSLLRRTIREDISIQIILASEIPPIMGDIGQLEQVIMNLSVNAQDAMPHGGELTIETARIVMDDAYAKKHERMTPGTYIQLTVTDTGSGMDTATFDKIFEPFFTTKAKGRGTGLGLATVYGIVKQHNGNIWAYSEPHHGTSFKVLLPICATEPTNNHSCAPVPTAAPKGTEHILLVEDNEQVRRLAHTLLTRTGYTVLVAESGPDALDTLKKHKGPLHLLLTDVVMPNMNGKQLFHKVAATHPGVKVLYMSGYTENVITQRGVINAGINFLHKPFTIEALSAKVREVLDAGV